LRSSRVAAVALVTFATFTDIVAYSVAVPVLPDLGRRLGASPTVIGLLFGSFGVTLLTVSVPMGAASDRLGRRAPLVSGLVVLAAATLLFAFGDSLPWLFAARLAQGAADAITWVVGFALIADLYGAAERGRVTGIVMMGTSFALMIGPTLGGWLYEVGGMRLPFIAVGVLAVLGAGAFAWLDIPARQVDRDPVPIALVLRVPAVAACAGAVVALSSTLSMLEPVLAMHLQTLGVNPGRIGLVYGVAAVSTTLLHPIYGRASDRYGARRLTALGLGLAACVLPFLSRAWSFPSAIGLFVLQASAAAMAVTPSLAYMGEATSSAGMQSFGVAYGLYNLAWGVGLLAGPALGGFLFERMGFVRLGLAWAMVLIVVTGWLGRVRVQS
jgi:MFS family permease